MDNKKKRQEFYEAVYSVVRDIPRGSVATYGMVAMLIGHPQNSRLVGRVLAEVPPDAALPCHRVVNAQGRLVPGWTAQRRLLEQEGVAFRPNGCVDLKRHLWR